MSAPGLVAGQIVGGRFTIRRERARTELVTTYEAITAPSRGVDLKLLDPSIRQRPDFDACMTRTMSATRELPSSLALQILDVGVDQETGAPFVATELSVTPSLSELVQLCPLAPGEVVSFARNLALALQAAHTRGVAHLALSPDNVFVGTPPRFEVRIADFGAHWLLGAAGTDALWSAPERAERPQIACDVFSAALITLFAATGATLRDRSEAALRSPAASLARQTGSAVDPRWEAPLARALAVDPAQRYATVAELAEALAQALGLPAAATSLARPPRPMPDPFAAPRPASAPEPVAAPRPASAPEPVAAPRPASAPEPVPAPFVAPEPFATTMPFTASDAFAPPAPPAPAPPAPAPPAAPPPAAPPPSEMAFATAQADPIFVESPPFDPIVAGLEPRKAMRWVLVAGGIALSLGALGLLGWTVSRRGAERVGGAASPATSGSSALAEPTSLATLDAPPPAAPATTPGTAPSGAPAQATNLTVSCTPECDVVTIDGAPVGTFPAVLAPGEHTVTALRGRHPLQTKRVAVAAGEAQTVSFVFLAPRPVAAPKKPCGKFLKRCD